MGDTQVLSFRIPSELKEQIEKAAQVLGIPLSDLLREASAIIALAAKEKEKQQALGKMIVELLSKAPDMDFYTSIDGAQVSITKQTSKNSVQMSFEYNKEKPSRTLKFYVYYRWENYGSRPIENLYVYANRPISSADIDEIITALRLALSTS